MPQGFPHSRHNDDPDYSYPVESDNRDDEAAMLFLESGGTQLQEAATRLYTALVSQAIQLERYPSTPFTTQNIDTIKVTVEAVGSVQVQLERWHRLIYPNQPNQRTEE